MVADVTAASKLLVWTLAGRVQRSAVGPLICAGLLSREFIADITFARGATFDHDFTVAADDNADDNAAFARRRRRQ